MFTQHNVLFHFRWISCFADCYEHVRKTVFIFVDVCLHNEFWLTKLEVRNSIHCESWSMKLTVSVPAQVFEFAQKVMYTVSTAGETDDFVQLARSPHSMDPCDAMCKSVFGSCFFFFWLFVRNARAWLVRGTSVVGDNKRNVKRKAETRSKLINESERPQTEALVE